MYIIVFLSGYRSAARLQSELQYSRSGPTVLYVPHLRAKTWAQPVTSCRTAVVMDAVMKRSERLIQELRNDTKFFDAEIRAGGETFPIHRNVVWIFHERVFWIIQRGQKPVARHQGRFVEGNKY